MRTMATLNLPSSTSGIWISDEAAVGSGAVVATASVFAGAAAVGAGVAAGVQAARNRAAAVIRLAPRIKVLDILNLLLNRTLAFSKYDANNNGRSGASPPILTANRRRLRA